MRLTNIIPCFRMARRVRLGYIDMLIVTTSGGWLYLAASNGQRVVFEFHGSILTGSINGGRHGQNVEKMNISPQNFNSQFDCFKTD